mmetsp:Transcript_399/g.622  ORF Transcript_399/g.622 Transcript_399/m.622 type:complete len:318 (+) Transcript_399:1676-2629(+)
MMLRPQQRQNLGNISTVALIYLPLQKPTQLRQTNPRHQIMHRLRFGGIGQLKPLRNHSTIRILILRTGMHKLIIAIKQIDLPNPHTATRYRCKVRSTKTVRAQLLQYPRTEKLLDIARRAKLRNLSIQFGIDNHRTTQIRIRLLHNLTRLAVFPIRSILHTQYNVILTLHLRNNELLRLPSRCPQCTLLRILWHGLLQLGSIDQPGRINQNHIRTVFILHANVNLARVKAAHGVALQPRIFTFDILLNFRHRFRSLHPILAMQIASRCGASRIVLHAECNRSARLSPAANLVELETHQRFNQCAFPGTLMSHDQYCW